MAQSLDLKQHRQEEKRLRELLQKQEQKRGFLVAFEGPQGSGKTTQRRLFKKWLETVGHEVVTTKWSSSPLIKPLIKARKQAHSFSPQEYCLLHAADFRQQLDDVILPALWSGKLVIADGYLFTGLARDGVRGVELDWALTAYQPLFWPDLVLYFAVSAETSGKRISAKQPPKFYAAGQDVTAVADPFESYKQYVARINQEYQALAQIFQMITVDAEQSIYEQHRGIREMFRQRTRRPWAQWNIDAMMEWLTRRLQTPEVQLGL